MEKINKITFAKLKELVLKDELKLRQFYYDKYPDNYPTTEDKIEFREGLKELTKEIKSVKKLDELTNIMCQNGLSEIDAYKQLLNYTVKFKKGQIYF